MKEQHIERQLLAHLLLDNGQYPLVAHMINVKLFEIPIHKDIFKAFTTLVDKQHEPDSFTISELLKGKYPNIFTEVSGLEEINIFNSNIHNVISLMHQRFQVRQLKLMGQMLSQISDSEKPSKYIDQISETIHELSNSGSQKQIKEFSQDIDELIEHFKNQDDNELSGIPTGLKELDSHTRGFQLEDLIIVGGETSQGKTSISISMVYNAILFNNPTLFISLEMSSKQLTARTMAHHTRVSSKRMLYYNLADGEKDDLATKMDSARPFPFYIDDSCGSKYKDIVAQIRRYVVQKRVRLVVIDYLQLMNNDKHGATKEQEIGDIARGLKNLAKELKIAIILISQLSRNKENPKPTLSRLRQSGQIEEAADVVIFVYRPEYYGNDYMEYHGLEQDMVNKGICYVAKGRGIGTTDFLLGFNKELTMWHNIESEHFSNIESNFENESGKPF